MWNAPTVYDDHAHEASRAYLDHGHGLTQSVAKIASRESLAPEEIQRVSERANQEVLEALREQPGDQNWEFERVTKEGVLQVLHPVKKAASGFIASDVRIKPGQEKVASSEYEDEDEDEPWRRGNMEKLAHLREATAVLHSLDKEAEYAQEEALQEGVFHFIKIAQRMVVEEDYAFLDLHRALADARPKQADLVASLLGLAEARLGPTLQKVAGPAPAHLFRPSMSQGGRPVRIINGDHALVMTLDTLVEQDHEHGTPAGPSADDTKKTVVREVRNLTGRHVPLQVTS